MPRLRREPILLPDNTLFIQLPAATKRTINPMMVPPSSRGIQLQLKTNLRAQFKTRKEDRDNEYTNRMYLSQNGGCKPIKTQPHRETGHDPAVNACDLDGTCQSASAPLISMARTAELSLEMPPKRANFRD